MIAEWIRQSFLDRLSSYSNFDAKLRRPDYSKNLLLDDNFELTKKKVSELYSSEFTTADAMMKLKDMSLDELDSSNDPLVRFVRSTVLKLWFIKKYDERRARRQLLKSNFVRLLRQYYQSNKRNLC